MCSGETKMDGENGARQNGQWFYGTLVLNQLGPGERSRNYGISFHVVDYKKRRTA
jgi:hypothetical protein